MEFSAALPKDFPSVLRLQAPNFIDNLSATWHSPGVPNHPEHIQIGKEKTDYLFLPL